MNHVISVDEKTYQTIKKLAYDEGRTVSGQLRVAINEYASKYHMQLSMPKQGLVNPMALLNNAPKKRVSKPMSEKPMSEERIEILKLENQLDEMDEDSEEYIETLRKIQKLQKKDLTR